MKRTDLEGGLVRPRPIYNSHERGTAFKFRYQYLKDQYPDPDSIKLDDLVSERKDFSAMDLESITYDYNISFSKYTYNFLKGTWERMVTGSLAEDEKELSEEDLSLLRYYESIFQYDQPVRSVSSYEQLQKLLEPYEIVIHKKLTVAEFMYRLRTKQGKLNDLPETVVKEIYSLLIETKNSPINRSASLSSVTDEYDINQKPDTELADASMEEFADFYSALGDL